MTKQGLAGYQSKQGGGGKASKATVEAATGDDGSSDGEGPDGGGVAWSWGPDIEWPAAGSSGERPSAGAAPKASINYNAPGISVSLIYNYMLTRWVVKLTPLMRN